MWRALRWPNGWNLDGFLPFWVKNSKNYDLFLTYRSKNILIMIPYGRKGGFSPFRATLRERRFFRLSLLIDVILVAVFVFCVVYYTKKGFVHSLMGITRFWLALIPSVLLSAPLAEKFDPYIQATLGGGEGDSFWSDILQRALHTGYVSRVLAFALLFLAATLLVKLLELLLRYVVELPGIHFVNKALGTVLGIVAGLLWLQILSVIFMAGAELLSGSVSWLTPDYFENAILAKYLYEKNLFRLFFEALTAS